MRYHNVAVSLGQVRSRHGGTFPPIASWILLYGRLTPTDIERIIQLL